MNTHLKDRNKAAAYLIPFVFIASVIPLVVRARVFKLEGILYNLKGVKEYFDYFSSYKAKLIITAALVGLLLILLRSIWEGFRLKKSLYYLPLGIYFFFIILSTVFSEYPRISVTGFMERYEGLLVLTSYLVATIIIFNFINTETDMKFISTSLLISAAVLGIIGILQFAGYDPLKMDFIKKLMMPSQYHYLLPSIKYNFGKYNIYSTLYNPNYVGSYTAMLLPMSVTLYILAGKRIKKIFAGVLSTLIFANLLGSHSRAGMVGTIFATILLLVICRKKIMENILYVAILAITFTAVYFGMNSFSNGSIKSKIDRINPQIDYKSSLDRDIRLSDILFKDNSLSIVTLDETLEILYDNGHLKFCDKSGRELTTVKGNDGKYVFTDKEYTAYAFILKQINGRNIMEMTFGRMNLKIFFGPDGFFIGDCRGNPVNEILYPEYFDPTGGYLTWGRAYILSRTIPMMKETVFLGKGPDTFAIYFPQQDYIGKLNFYGGTGILVDKPHNMYLQTAVNTGLLSLLALISVFAAYFVSSIRIYLREKTFGYIHMTGLACFVSTCGYLVAGVFNDSNVSVAPVFWIIFGMGMAINHINKKARVSDT